MNQIDLNNRHAVVTGAAQGIGFSVTSRLLQSGASVSLWDRDADMLQTASAQLAGKGAVSIEVVDVSDAESVNAATSATLRKHGRIDILVANAGIAGPNTPVHCWPVPWLIMSRVAVSSTLGVTSVTLMIKRAFAWR